MLTAVALRDTGSWSQLAAQTEAQEWGPEFEYVRWAYLLQAAEGLGQNELADDLRQTRHNQLFGVHALFIASTFYSWGQISDALNIWWQIAEMGGRLAIEYLVALARHYQVHRDTDGQYRVFRDLYFAKSHDNDIGNNFAFLRC